MPAPKAPFIRLMEGFSVSDNGCWEWNGNTTPKGYGIIKVFGDMVSTHRYSYELHKGPIPSGAHILHSCDNKICINPNHLRAGTHLENMREAKERNRMRSGVNHPMHGKKQKRPKQAKPVMVLGKFYESQNEAERQLGLGSGTVSYWLKNKPEKAQYSGRENTNA